MSSQNQKQSFKYTYICTLHVRKLIEIPTFEFCFEKKFGFQNKNVK